MPLQRMILWDVDGVLLKNFAADGRSLWSATLEKDLGISASLLDPLFRTMDSQTLAGQTTALDAIASFFSAHNVACDPARFLTYWLDRDLNVDPATLAFLERAPACLATNQTPERATRLEALFKGRVQKIFASCRMGCAKPDPSFFAMIEKALALPPSALYLIDDSRKNGAAAQARGWNALLFKGNSCLAPFFETFQSCL